MPETTGCCIVGGGPAGAVLALLLVRQGVTVTLLEAKHDFDRDFRGDTVHPSTLEMLDDLGLADRLLAREHGVFDRVTLRSDPTAFVVADFRRLHTRFPFIAMIPQVEFLDFIVGEARRHDGFTLRMGARADGLVTEDGVVRGVRYRDDTGAHEVRAPLTVAADGRGSRMRQLAGWTPQRHAAPMDVLWMVVPRAAADRAADLTGFRVGRGRLGVVLARAHAWQIAYVLLKGDYPAVRAAGLDVLRRELGALVPELADRFDAIGDWSDVRFLSVESSRLATWHRPGLLAIGDAAHVMSPVGGVGINYAVQDAVATANLLAAPLRAGQVSDDQLAAVQRRREWPTRFVQRFQRIVQQVLVRRALDDRPFRPPLALRVITRLPLVRDLPARIVGWGLRPERVRAASEGTTRRVTTGC